MGERDENNSRKVQQQFVWDVAGAQKTSVPDLACGFSIIPCLLCNVVYQDPSDGIHIHKTTPCDLISKCPENQAATIAWYLGLCYST